MRKRSLLALMLAFVLTVTLSSCSLIEKDPEVDKETVIIEIGDKQISKQEVQDAYDTQLYMESFYSQQYGYTLDATDPDTISRIQDSAIESLIRQSVLKNKVTELKMNEFSEDEIDKFTQEAQTTLDNYIDSIKSQYFTDTELNDVDLEKAVTDKMVELEYPTLDDLIENNKDTAALNALKDSVIKDLNITDEEINAEYEKKVATAKANYDSNLSGYGSDILNGTTVYYAPSGYRNVKNLLIKLSDDDDSLISDLNTQIADKQNQITTTNSSIADLDKEMEDYDEQLTNLESLLDGFKADLEELNNELISEQESAYAKLDEVVSEIETKIAEGEDFEALLEQYGEDPGMDNDGIYAVCNGFTSFDPDFTLAAMDLENIGDVSEAIKTSFGYHFIKYISDVEEGNIPLENLKDEIESELLSAKENDTYDAQVQTWVDEANAKIFKDRLVD